MTTQYHQCGGWACAVIFTKEKKMEITIKRVNNGYIVGDYVAADIEQVCKIIREKLGEPCVDTIATKQAENTNLTDKVFEYVKTNGARAYVSRNFVECALHDIGKDARLADMLEQSRVTHIRVIDGDIYRA